MNSNDLQCRITITAILKGTCYVTTSCPLNAASKMYRTGAQIHCRQNVVLGKEIVVEIILCPSELNLYIILRLVRLY